MEFTVASVFGNWLNDCLLHLYDDEAFLKFLTVAMGYSPSEAEAIVSFLGPWFYSPS